MKIYEIISVLEELAYGAEDAANDEQFSKSAKKRHRHSAQAIREAIELLKTYQNNQNKEKY